MLGDVVQPQVLLQIRNVVQERDITLPTELRLIKIAEPFDLVSVATRAAMESTPPNSTGRIHVAAAADTPMALGDERRTWQVLIWVSFYCAAATNDPYASLVGLPIQDSNPVSTGIAYTNL